VDVQYSLTYNKTFTCIGQFPLSYVYVRILLVYSLSTGFLAYSFTVVTSGWFGSAVLTAYWITWIQFHSDYVRLVWLLLMYSLRTGLLGYSSTAVTSGWFGYC